MGVKRSNLKTITVRQCGSNQSKGIMTAGSRQFSCALGRSGLTNLKREGDGATPVGSFEILKGYYRADRVQICGSDLKLERITADMGWCDQPGDRNYNRQIKLPYRANHENMWRKDFLYDWCLVLDQNYSERMRGRGSAIFLHLATADYRSTEGCVAIKLSDMRWLIGQIGRQTRLVIVR